MPPIARLHGSTGRLRASRSIPLWLLAFLLPLLAACGGGGASPAQPSHSSTESAVASFGYSEASFRDAARITAAAQVEVGRTVRAGLYERDIKTTIDRVFSSYGSGPVAFPHIVGSGPNALDLHYEGDGRQLQDGDFVVVDIGATSNAHCADLTRTYIVSGQMTSRQRAIYDLVLQSLRDVAPTLRVGVDSIATADEWVRAAFRWSPLRAKNAAGVEQTLDRFFVHLVGHYVGRQIHGQDTPWNWKAPIQVGQVLALEPGVYIPSEGIGVRIEDTFLVTPSGLECLTCAAPK